tara:strand:- start:9014 stop:9289 length:276 start_codon:yes stop_codon:yes gene_type:complete
MKTTHKTRLLDYLKNYGSITSLEAIRDLGNTRLSATIFTLKKDGYNIDSDMVKVPTRFKKPNGDSVFTEVARYSLSITDRTHLGYDPNTWK